MTRTEIIELANQLTERKGERVLSLPLLFTHVLQDFCGRNRYWWRNVYATFPTASGTLAYDLSAVATPTLAEVIVEEVISLGLIQSGQMIFLDPVFDTRTLTEMRQGLNQNGAAVAGTPARYTMDDYKTLRLDNPNGIYSMFLQFWAMPNAATDSTSDAVPLVPPNHHKALVAGMEQKIWKRVEGIGSKQYLAAKGEYEDAIFLAQARPRFTTNYSQQLTPTEDAVRST